MTSKVVPAAPRDSKSNSPLDEASKEDVKASVTSATDEPNSLSTATSLLPPAKKDKLCKAAEEPPKPLQVPSEAKPEPNDTNRSGDDSN